MVKKALFVLKLFVVVNVFGQSLVINEIMSVNDATIFGMDGDYSDWIELYNASDDEIDLSDFYLSDDVTNLEKWEFPEIELPAHEFVLVFASKKDIHDTNELHANFKISSEGEDIYLCDDDGIIIDYVPAIPLLSDQSFIRTIDGGNDWTKTDNASPGLTNNSINYLLFSHNEGFYPNSISLEIESTNSDTIRYTLNGSVPTANSPVLESPLLLENVSSNPNTISEIPTTPDEEFSGEFVWKAPDGFVDKAIVLRCGSFNNGNRTSEEYTKTYFIGEDIASKFTVPVISLVTDSVNLFDNDTGIYIPGQHFNEDNPDWSGNYYMRGDDWERDVHIEYFNDQGDLCLSQLAGMRIHGGKSRLLAQKSLRLYARHDEYGKKYFKYELLPNRDEKKYKRFLLRSPLCSWGGACLYKDVIAHQIFSDLNVEYQDSRPVVVFVNGEYWGIHTIRDRIDERYIEYLYDYDEDSINFDIDSYVDLIESIEDLDMSDNSNYEYLLSQIDIHNFIDYTIIETFFANYDWPANNFRVWRKASDGKWRFIPFDFDAAFGNYNYNMFNHLSQDDPEVGWPNSAFSTLLFRKLFDNDNFRSLFLSRYAEVLNGEFLKGKILHEGDSIINLYRPELHAHIERWNYPESEDAWENDFDNIIMTFMEERQTV